MTKNGYFELGQNMEYIGLSLEVMELTYNWFELPCIIL